MGSNPITDYLQRMFNRRYNRQYGGNEGGAPNPNQTIEPSSPGLQPAGPGGNPYADQLPNPFSGMQGLSPDTPLSPSPYSYADLMEKGPSAVLAKPTAPGVPTPGQRGVPIGYMKPGSKEWTEKFGPYNVSQSDGDTSWMGGPDTTNDKLNPQGSISFAWKGGELQKYDPRRPGGLQPNITPDQYGSQLEQSRSRGLMGHPGVINFPSAGQGPDFQQGPGFSPSQTDWSKVANPMAFEAYREQPELKDIQQYLNDPMWREKQTAQIEQAKQIAIARAQAAAVQSALAKAAQDRQDAIEKIVRPQIDAENEKRKAQGKPPLTASEENQLYYSPYVQRATEKFGLLS